MTKTNLLTTVVECLAEAEGIEPAELDYKLHDYIDPEILTHLGGRPDASWTFTFQVPNHEVTLTAGGLIAIDGTVYRGSCDTTSPVPNALGQESTEIQRRYQNLLTSLPGAVYQCRNERGWPIDFISEGCRQLTGYDPNAFIVGGVSWGADIIHPDDRETVWKQVQDSLQVNEPFHLTYRIRTANGDQKQVWGKGSGVFKQGEVVALTGFITDITDVSKKGRVPEEA